MFSYLPRLQRTRALSVALISLMSIALLACGTDDEDPDTNGGDVPNVVTVTSEPEDGATPVPAVTVEAEILGGTSEDIEINTGDSIEWTNSDDETRLISGEGFDATTVEPGDTFTHTFDEEGSYEIEIDEEQRFVVTVVSQLQPEEQGTGVPHEPAETDTPESD